ncbi:MAG: 16S rRNA (guanine(527)-N(7))-methyltransferase RsmG [Lachnospiraceae bacterium]|nr:16S rRNA (guanine(527)-N(7))-methyltransferase RsmG [Lachnospiraceae bacterium]
MSVYDTSQFRRDLQSIQVQLTDQQIDQFVRYFEMLVEWNGFMNLTGITDYEEVMKKHFIDSLSLTKIFDTSRECRVIDVGTGAGFPGLALKIAFPWMEMTLLDSLNKRIQFLNAVINELGLNGVHTLHGRAEDYAKPGQIREQYDLCVSRAVAHLASLCEYCLPFVKVGGCFVSYKSEKVSEELEISKNAIFLLGGKMNKAEEFTLPDSDIYRSLICIEKVQPTSKKYPRKAGVPIRQPIK